MKYIRDSPPFVPVWGQGTIFRIPPDHVIFWPSAECLRQTRKHEEKWMSPKYSRWFRQHSLFFIAITSIFSMLAIDWSFVLCLTSFFIITRIMCMGVRDGASRLAEAINNSTAQERVYSGLWQLTGSNPAQRQQKIFTESSRWGWLRERSREQEEKRLGGPLQDHTNHRVNRLDWDVTDLSKTFWFFKLLS